MEQIKDFMGWFLPLWAIVGPLLLYLVHSPLGSKLPSKVVKVLTFLSGPVFDEIIRKLQNAMLSKENRIALAADYLRRESAGTEWELTPDEARRAVIWIDEGLKSGRGYIEKVLGRK